ncbi:hypothetical protein FOC22_16995 [Shigella flexneri]|nr:hypothetical protein SF148580_1801 [Shigella flexneri 1485-80]QKX29636.1 hypothetical protein FOC22_16995 [Shigella flexneri]HAY8850093.1 hypothetical protein [Shigella boydii]
MAAAVTDALLVFFRQLAPFVVLPALGIFIIHGTVRQAVGFIVMPERDQALMSLTVI